MSAEQTKTGVFEKPITDAEIDELLGNVISPDEQQREDGLVQSLRKELDNSLSGIKLEKSIGSPEEDIVVSAEDITNHSDIVETIQKSIKRIDFVQNVFMAWNATLFRAPDGGWLVDLPGRTTALPLDRVLRGLRDSVLKPMVEAKKAQGGAGKPPFSPIR